MEAVIGRLRAPGLGLHDETQESHDCSMIKQKMQHFIGTARTDLLFLTRISRSRPLQLLEASRSSTMTAFMCGCSRRRSSKSRFAAFRSQSFFVVPTLSSHLLGIRSHPRNGRVVSRRISAKVSVTSESCTPRRITNSILVFRR